jgi:S1-C subfamily serine protease
VITNAHVVRGRSPEVVLSTGDRLHGRLLAYDERNDLAAISVESESLPSLALGNSRQLRPGSLVIALGHPWGVVGAATAGMVISVGYPVERLPYGGELIQVGLHLRPGHSGGPLLNDKGEVIGINTMIAGPHVGLAIPAVTVARFLQETLGSRRGKRRLRERSRVPI